MKRVPLSSVVLLILAQAMSFAQSSVRGKVTDPSNTPLANVKVTSSYGDRIVYTDSQGEFQITDLRESEPVTLRFELEGYYGESVEVKPGAGETALSVVLTPQIFLSETVTVTASRMEVPLVASPAATAVVTETMLETMPRTVAADEALRYVPGVKVDNQANGERVHLSMRGQGILTERGIRGIQILLDGIPLNDPSGFAPDLFDVDWAAVEKVETVRGPVAFLYGGGSAGGIVSVVTREVTDKRAAGEASASGGSNGFWKGRGEVGGKTGTIDYFLSASHGEGDGYREHTAFWGNNLYGKLNWNPREDLRLHGIVAGTGYFNQNAEGLNLEWLAQDRRMANPDAILYNEYQKTLRLSSAVQGQWDPSSTQNLLFTFYFRRTKYDESVPSSVQHRTYNTPGGSLQYRADFGGSAFRNTFSAGLDLDGQSIADIKYQNLGGAQEGPDPVADQDIGQRRVGAFVQDRVEMGPHWAVLLALRHDRIRNELTDFLKLNGLDLSGEAEFQHTTGRVGVTWNPTPDFGLFGGWGQGFLPPATEELYANPDALGGFNTGLIPATSHGVEIGARGSHDRKFLYDVTLFRLVTHDDFERYRIRTRPLETFYRNAGNSRRYGLEALVRWMPIDPLSLIVTYTYSDFIYTEYYSLSLGGDQSGNFLPNSPRHQAFVEGKYRLGTHWYVALSSEMQSRSYVDATNLTWIDGFALLDTRVAYMWEGHRARGELFVAGKNVTGVEYIAFTEPDPDGNSYQPGPTAEVFAGVRFTF